MDIFDLIVMRPENKLLADAPDHISSLPFKKCTRYENEVKKKLNKMATRTAMQMKPNIFSGKNAVSIIAFLQIFKAAYDASSNFETAGMRAFKYYAAGPVEAVIKPQKVFWAETARSKNRSLTWFAAIVDYLL